VIVRTINAGKQEALPHRSCHGFVASRPAPEVARQGGKTKKSTLARRPGAFRIFSNDFIFARHPHG
jgi:hypothetical protein